MRIVCDYRGWTKEFDVSSNVVLVGYFDMFDPFKEEELMVLSDATKVIPKDKCVKVFRFVDRGSRRAGGIPIFEYYD